MRLVAIWTSLALCLIPAVYVAPVAETPQVPQTGLSKLSLSSRPSDIHVRLNNANDDDRYQNELRENIEALAKIVAGAWGDNHVGNQQFKFQDPPERFPDHFVPSTKRFELSGGMKGCEDEVNGEWPCVGYIYSVNPVEGSLTSRIRKQRYNTMKVNHLEEWNGGPLR